MFRPIGGGFAAVLAVMVLGVAGCGLVKEAGSAEPTASITASPSPKLVTEAGIRVQVRRATIELVGFHPQTSSAPEDQAGTWKVMSTCKALPSDRKRTAGYQRLWDGKTIWIRNYVVGYLDVEGTQLVDEARAVTTACKKYKTSDGRQVTVVGEMDLTTPEGVHSSFAYCELISGKRPIHQCNAVLAHGHFLSEIDASDHTRAASEEMLRKLVPIAAKALLDNA